MSGHRAASPFSRQVANGNTGPASVFESMRAKPYFLYHVLNIDQMYKNSKREKVLGH